jgi:hypothetical protein
MNILLGKPELELADAIEEYNRHYIPPSLELYGRTKERKYTVAMFSAIVLFILLVIWWTIYYGP